MIGTIRAATHFQIIDARMSYRLLLGGLGFISTEFCPPRITNSSTPFGGKQVQVNASEAPFQKDESYFFEVAIFDELIEDGEVTLTVLEVCYCQYARHMRKWCKDLMRKPPPPPILLNLQCR